MKRNAVTKSIARVLPFPIAVTAFWSVILIVISLILLLLSTLRPQVFEGIRTTLSDRFAPVLRLVSWPFDGATSLFSNVRDIAALRAESERLESENARLREWYQMALLLESENKSLRELLNLKIDPEFEYMSARIISGSGQNFVKSLLVAAGTRDGVSKGDSVLTGDGLIGRLIETGENTSRILLVTDINSRVPIIIEGTTLHAIMRGVNTDTPELIFFPRESEIAEGARVITSGHGGIYPPRLPVGRIETDGEGRKLVRLFADSDRLQFVRILLMNGKLNPAEKILQPITSEKKEEAQKTEEAVQ